MWLMLWSHIPKCPRPSDLNPSFSANWPCSLLCNREAHFHMLCGGLGGLKKKLKFLATELFFSIRRHQSAVARSHFEVSPVTSRMARSQTDIVQSELLGHRPVSIVKKSGGAIKSWRFSRYAVVFVNVAWNKLPSQLCVIPFFSLYCICVRPGDTSFHFTVWLKGQ